jgi:hypothetical protein
MVGSLFDFFHLCVVLSSLFYIYYKYVINKTILSFKNEVLLD